MTCVFSLWSFVELYICILYACYTLMKLFLKVSSPWILKCIFCSINHSWETNEYWKVSVICSHWLKTLKNIKFRKPKIFVDTHTSKTIYLSVPSIMEFWSMQIYLLSNVKEDLWGKKTMKFLCIRKSVALQVEIW